MQPGRRHLSVGTGIALASVVLAACGGATSTDDSQRPGFAATPTTDPVTMPPEPSRAPGVAVPDVIGQKITPARNALHAAGLRSVGLNVPCNKGTAASQSVVDSLALPGKIATPDIGAIAIEPGAKVEAGTRIGIRWSGCYGNAVVIPAVVGLSFAGAKHAIKGTGLTWACYSIEKPTTPTTPTTPTAPTAPPTPTTLAPPATSTSTPDFTPTTSSGTTSTAAPSSTTSSTVPSSSTSTSTTSPSATTLPVTPATEPPAGIVLGQDPRAGGVLRPGATVAFTMRACPQ